MSNIQKRNPNEIIGGGLVLGGIVWSVAFYSIFMLLPILAIIIGTTMIDFRK